ncbi:MAG: glutamyl-tRNA reductase [Bacteroidetes bacterium SW_9_63_38]|nr:MAG: glutamyl-tRNA reductase [Bacteroidetes bacterium SW_9_63_38]
MKFHALGVNHEHGSVEQTDAFALDADEQRALYDNLILSEEAEVVVLSTCNRTEAYLYGRALDVRRMEAALADAAGETWPSEEAFRYVDEAAVRHLLHVTAGLKSMVLGDQQILAQVKDAYQRAVDADQVHSLMHRLLHTAFRAAKRVSTETELSSGAASVSTASVEMARHYFKHREAAQSLAQLRVLLVGAGKMGRLALKSLQSDAPASVTITNRSRERAEALAETHGGEVRPWNERYDALTDANFVIVATGAPEPILRAPSMPVPGEQASTPLIVDIARPRNVDPAIDEHDGYTVYDLDDLQTWTRQVRERRSSAVPKAREICEGLLQDFVTWVFHQQALQPAIQAIRETFNDIRKQEVDRHAHRTDMDREEVDRLTKSIMQKLLAVPIVRLKNVDPDSIDFVQGVELLRALFAPSDDSGGRSLQEATSDGQPTLSDAPSRCPYLTHGSEEGTENEKALRQVLQVATDTEDSDHPESASLHVE